MGVENDGVKALLNGKGGEGGRFNGLECVRWGFIRGETVPVLFGRTRPYFLGLDSFCS